MTGTDKQLGNNISASSDIILLLHGNSVVRFSKV